MLILICGDRNWTNRESIRTVLGRFNPVEDAVMHGAARGADRIAGEEARALGFVVRSYPADWEAYGRAAGPIRNRLMLSQSPDLVIAFHPNLELSKGTKDMVKISKAKGITVEVHNA